MIFSQEEFNSRITKVKESMNKKGLEVLLTTDPSNMNYLTGYDGWSFYVPQGVILSIDEAVLNHSLYSIILSYIVFCGSQPKL